MMIIINDTSSMRQAFRDSDQVCVLQNLTKHETSVETQQLPIFSFGLDHIYPKNKLLYFVLSDMTVITSYTLFKLFF